jgi:topoisomerase-4 subunit A
VSPKTADGGRIEPVDFAAALSERYLAYALSTITARSLPDVRDGLKPVQRRLLWAMRQLRLDPGSGFKKCARVVGDVIGKYHPHGDAAVYDALVRLAQTFAQRYPLVEGQGNFGNIDGDNAAAMRYTEARLSDVAAALLDGIDEDTVDFRDNYDGTDREPVVLPAAFPNLLANGAVGIAVGMATSIPPHNAGEVLRAAAWLLGRPVGAPPATTRELLRFVKGPDLPTGGVLIEPREALVEAYDTGRGSLRVRARWQVEKLPHGQYRVAVTEIPWLVQKARLVEKLAELLAQKKLPLLADLRDESAEEVRLVLVPRSRSVPPEALMEQLFRATELEQRIQLNMNVLDAEGVPRLMSLRALLEAWIAHRMEVLIRRSRFRLGRIEDRLELLDGYLRIFLDIDTVIRIIREEEDPKAELMRAFGLNERQATAVLDLRLRNLRRLEEMELRAERDRLVAEKAELTTLLADEAARRERLRAECLEMAERFGGGPRGRRRTGFAEAPEIDPAALELPVERVPVTVVLSEKGWIRAIRGHVTDPSEIRYKEGDCGRFVLPAQSTDRLLLFTGDGRCYTLAVDRLPGGRGTGEPLSLAIDLQKGVELTALLVHRPEGRVVLATASGRGFLAEEKALLAQTRAGRQVVNLAEGDRLLRVAPVPEGAEHLAVLGDNRKLLVFPLEELPVMGRGRGVVLQRYRDGGLADILPLRLEDGLSWQQGERTRSVPDLAPWLGRRAQAGRLAPHGFPRDNLFRPVR